MKTFSVTRMQANLLMRALDKHLAFINTPERAEVFRDEIDTITRWKRELTEIMEDKQ